MQKTEGTNDPGIRELLRSLAHGLSALLRQEVEFARVELTKQRSQLQKGVIFLAVGAVLGYSGLLVLLAAAVFGLAEMDTIPLWLSALIVGGAVVLIGMGLLLSGRNHLKPDNLKPHQTMELLKEDMQWMKNQIS